MSINTIAPGVLCVGAALPDPPFELMEGDKPSGFDIELMQAVAAELHLEWRLIRYTDDDFNGIFAGLANETYDCVAQARRLRQSASAWRRSARRMFTPAKASSATSR